MISPFEQDPKKVFVGGLSSRTDERSLRNYFSKFGVIEEAVVISDKKTNRSRGFGFIICKDQKVTDTICNKDHVLDGKRVECKKAVPKTVTDDIVAETIVDPQLRKIFIGGIPHTVTEDEMKIYFQRYGGIEECVIIKEKDTGKSKGFGFVTFLREECLSRVMTDYLKHKLGGKWVECKRALPKDHFLSPNSHKNEVTTGFGGTGAQSPPAEARDISPQQPYYYEQHQQQQGENYFPGAPNLNEPLPGAEFMSEILYLNSVNNPNNSGRTSHSPQYSPMMQPIVYYSPQRVPNPAPHLMAYAQSSKMPAYSNTSEYGSIDNNFEREQNDFGYQPRAHTHLHGYATPPPNLDRSTSYPTPNYGMRFELETDEIDEMKPTTSAKKRLSEVRDGEVLLMKAKSMKLHESPPPFYHFMGGREALYENVESKRPQFFDMLARNSAALAHQRQLTKESSEKTPSPELPETKRKTSGMSPQSSLTFFAKKTKSIDEKCGEPVSRKSFAEFAENHEEGEFFDVFSPLRLRQGEVAGGK